MKAVHKYENEYTEELFDTPIEAIESEIESAKSERESRKRINTED